MATDLMMALGACEGDNADKIAKTGVENQWEIRDPDGDEVDVDER